MEFDLVRKVEEFRPDLIVISVLECTYSVTLSMLRAIENSNIPVIAGGVFPTFAPEVLLSNKNVHIVCVGEGEEALVELCKRISLEEDYSDVENLWFIEDGQMTR